MQLSEEKQILIARYRQDLLAYNLVRDPIERLALLNELESKWKEDLGYLKKDIEYHAAYISAPQNNQDDLKTSYTIDELTDFENEEGSWIVANILRGGGGLFIAAGQPKAGKTLLFGYQLSYSVAVSGDFLGQKCTKGNVLFFQREESLSTIARRYEDQGLDRYNVLAHDAIENKSIRVEMSFDITDLARLVKLIREHKPILVVIDSLRASFSNLDISENDSGISRYIYALQKTLINEGVTGVLIHHANKKSQGQGIEGMAGSLSLAGATDGIFMLWSDPKHDDGVINLTTKPREGIPSHYQIEIFRDPMTDYQSFRMIREVGVDPKVLSYERKILRFLNKESLTSKTDISEFLQTDMLDLNLSIALTRLSDSCQIVKKKVPDETSSSGFYVAYKLTENTDWDEFKQILHPEYAEAEKLVRCTSKDAVDQLSQTWASEYGDAFKFKVWTSLGKAEQERLRGLITPSAPIIADNKPSLLTEVREEALV
jgi:hypothetical protein